MKQQLLQLWRDEDGATAIEYALIAGLIAVVLIGTLTALGTTMDEAFEKISEAIAGEE
ncbi:Flp family type IVb pilin [Paenalcaligenes niemegkensis]|uniref:Flp family type IVb pilin n=1 Tax=Paenalcaligenes niemegkensis TaxID=2895469 RepID=UPI001EE9376B|nr:Flp family type IVb pilin [Paenalcaligenes niemegkensis]MCQ9616996.1 Flp family type IVb pilin [Paenalcaligenes niemegkensis]